MGPSGLNECLEKKSPFTEHEFAKPSTQFFPFFLSFFFFLHLNIIMKKFA